MICNWCGHTTARNVTRQRAHLDACKQYQKELQERRKRSRADSAGNSITPSPHKQLAIALSKWTQADEDEADQLAAEWLYEANLPFNLFEHPAAKRFFNKLRPSYTPPSAYRIANSLLDESYKKVKETVDAIIDEEEALGVVFDETTNVISDRVLNISITTSRGAFYYHNLILPPETASSSLLTNLVVESLDTVSRGKRERINACSTDTCSTMRDIWKLLPRQPGLEHCLMNPCDSHGIQLLIKDILEYPYWSSTVLRANQLVRHFKHSSKQLAILKDIQQRLIGGQNKIKPLVMASQVRWGTHCKEFQSILDNRQAFRAFALDQRTDLSSSDTARAVAKTLIDPSFYNLLEEIVTLIAPIHEEQVKSEGDTAHIGLVKNRWKRIMKHLEFCTKTISTDFNDLYLKLEERYQKQVNDIHYLAHWLDPQNIGIDRFYQFEQGRVLAVLESLIDPHQWEHTLLTFMQYYNRTGPFRDTNLHWNFQNKPDVFWQLYMDESRPLATLALRMRKTLANSCASERAFSAMKATHTITRNKLTPERINKLLFIQINQRVLKRGTFAGSNLTNAQNEESAKEIESEESTTLVVPQLQPIDAIKALQTNRNAEEDAEEATALHQGPKRVEERPNRPNMDIFSMLNSAGAK